MMEKMARVGQLINQVVFICCAGILFSCGNDDDKKIITDNIIVTPPVNHITPPDFNADSAYAHIKNQFDMGPRTPGSKAHASVIKYIDAQLKQFGAEVILQKGIATTFDQKKWELVNIIGSFNTKATTRVVLFTHYDSRPFCEKDSVVSKQKLACPGANDGASGVGVLLEIARLISKQQPRVGIDMIFLDLEDYGDVNAVSEDSWCLGSQYWSKNLHKPQYYAKYGILLDMVGGKDATFPMEKVSLTYASKVVSKVWSTAQNFGYGELFSQAEVGPFTDDHVYINKNAQIPTIDIIPFDFRIGNFFKHHHTTQDVLENIDKITLKKVGHTLVEVLYNEDDKVPSLN